MELYADVVGRLEALRREPVYDAEDTAPLLALHHQNLRAGHADESYVLFSC